MRDDERCLWLLVLLADGKLLAPRHLNDAGPRMPAKRLAYILERWAARGLYDYGVNVELGWLTDAGREFARSLLGGKP